MIKKLLILLTFLSILNANSQNNYLDFDGTNDYVDIPNSGTILANATAISISCKVFPKSSNPNFPNFNGIMGFRNETTFDFYLIQLSATQIEARFRNSTGTAFTLSYNGLILNQWNQLFLVYNGATLKLYSGATEVASIAASGSVPATNNSTFKIGLVQFQSFSWYHNGYIDEVSIWNKGLSSADVSAIVSNTGEIANPAIENNLKLYYKFNQGTAYGNNGGLTSLIDEKTNQNGLLTNFALTGNTSNWGGTNLSTISFQNSKLQLYPNPSEGYLNFSGAYKIYNVKIIDVSGRMVQENLVENQNSILDVSHLSAGIYIAVLNNDLKIKFSKK